MSDTSEAGTGGDKGADNVDLNEIGLKPSKTQARLPGGGTTFAERMRANVDARDRDNEARGQPDEDSDLEADGDEGHDDLDEDTGASEEGLGDSEDEDQEDEGKARTEAPRDGYAVLTSKLVAKEREAVSLKKSVRALEAEVKRLSAAGRSGGQQAPDPEDDYEAALAYWGRRMNLPPTDERVIDRVYDVGTESTLRKHNRSDDKHVLEWKEAKAKERAESAKYRELKDRQDSYERERAQEKVEAIRVSDLSFIGSVAAENSTELSYAIEGARLEGYDVALYVRDSIYQAINDGIVERPSNAEQAKALAMTAYKNLDAHYRRLAGVGGQKPKTADVSQKSAIGNRDTGRKSKPQAKRDGGTGSGNGSIGSETRRFRSLTDKVNHRREVEARRRRG